VETGSGETDSDETDLGGSEQTRPVSSTYSELWILFGGAILLSA
jgi:hypothetical protein